MYEIKPNELTVKIEASWINNFENWNNQTTYVSYFTYSQGDKKEYRCCALGVKCSTGYILIRIHVNEVWHIDGYLMQFRRCYEDDGLPPYTPHVCRKSHFNLLTVSSLT